MDQPLCGSARIATQATGLMTSHLATWVIFLILRLNIMLQANAVMDNGVQNLYSDGLISLSATGHVATLDDNAQRILNAGLGIRLSNGRLRSTSRDAASDDEALKLFLAKGAGETEPFVIQSKPGLFLLVHSYTVPHAFNFAHESAVQVLRIAIVNLKASMNSATVRRAFDLTTAEESVVAALTKSSSASAAARKLGLSRETVKTHLRSIYGKTGAVSLTQLMLLIGQLVNR